MFRRGVMINNQAGHVSTPGIYLIKALVAIARGHFLVERNSKGYIQTDGY